MNISDIINGDELLMEKNYQFTKLVDKNEDGFADFDEMKVGSFVIL